MAFTKSKAKIHRDPTETSVKIILQFEEQHWILAFLIAQLFRLKRMHTAYKLIQFSYLVNDDASDF